MKIIISGALGRMGRMLASIAKSTQVDVACGIDIAYQNQYAEIPMVHAYDEITQDADVLIDFSVTDSLPEILRFALRRKMPLVLCATGYTQDQLDAIANAAKQIPILQSANMSFGIQVLARLAAMAAKVLGEDFDVEIVEKHHNKKIDSPSGTALMLRDAVQNQRQLTPVYGRHGKMGERGLDEIGIHAVRGGSVTGEHEVGFYGNAEEIILTHRAESRTLFAKGALKGAVFLIKQPPGLYTLKDVVADLLD